MQRPSPGKSYERETRDLNCEVFPQSFAWALVETVILSNPGRDEETGLPRTVATS